MVLVRADPFISTLSDWIARKIADHLTAQTGVTVVFESAIVPKWKDSRICFQNVFITRRANAKDPESLRLEREKKKRLRLKQERDSRRKRRGTASTAGQGMAWEGVTMDDHHSDNEGVAPPLSSSATGEDLSDEERTLVETNFTMFDLNFDSIDVTLSISRWFDGKGLIEDAVVKGVRGIIGEYSFLAREHLPDRLTYIPRPCQTVAMYTGTLIESMILEQLGGLAGPVTSSSDR